VKATQTGILWSQVQVLVGPPEKQTLIRNGGGFVFLNYHLSMNQQELRNQLQDITLNHPSIHQRLLRERVQNHSLKVVSGFGNDLSYNCVMYALNLQNDQRYLDLRIALPGHIHADTKFLKFLIDQGFLVESEKGQLIIYFEGDVIKHIGKLSSHNRVVSKWGIGLLYDHELFDIPVDYGCSIKRFSVKGSPDIFVEFKNYVDLLLD